MITGKIDPEVARLALMLLEYDDIDEAKFACKVHGYPCNIQAGFLDAFVDDSLKASKSVAVSIGTKGLILPIGNGFFRLDRETAKSTIEAHL